MRPERDLMRHVRDPIKLCLWKENTWIKAWYIDIIRYMDD